MPLAFALAVVLLGAAAYLVAEVVTAPARERQRSVVRAATYGRLRIPETGLERLRFRERVFSPATHSLARLALRLNRRLTVEAVGLRLLAAGMGRTITPTAFLALKALFGAAGALLGFLIGGSSWGVLGALAFGAMCGGAGFAAPDVLVTFRAKARREKIRAQLPDTLDLLAVSVEAGLGFDGAVATFARAIVQADQLGISLGRILRVQAAETRLKRQAAAEEKAMKAPIKMLFPTVAFIFPAMFMVVLGPALMGLGDVF